MPTCTIKYEYCVAPRRNCVADGLQVMAHRPSSGLRQDQTGGNIVPWTDGAKDVNTPNQAEIIPSLAAELACGLGQISLERLADVIGLVKFSERLQRQTFGGLDPVRERENPYSQALPSATDSSIILVS